jgi:DNA-binding transcriptional ArsR family regulator
MVVDNLSSAFAALSDPTRRMILDRLTRGPATVNELARPFEISQQAISKHLAHLERARFIEKTREGREHYCSLKTDAIREVANWAMGYRRFWEQSHARLDLLLEKMKVADHEQTTGRKRGRIKR